MKITAAEERWPLIEWLVGLGWPVRTVAEAIDWSEATVSADLKKRGGVKQLFPDRPKGSDCYAESFKVYLDSGTPSHVRNALHRVLEVEVLQRLVRVSTTFINGLCEPICSPEQVPYRKLWRVIDQSVGGEPALTINIWHEYCDDVSRGLEPLPGHRGEVLAGCRRAMAVRCQRDYLLLHAWPAAGAFAFIDRVLDSDKLTPREKHVIRKNFGIGCERASIEEIAEEWSVTRARVSSIYQKALRKLRYWKERLGWSPLPTVGDQAAEVQALRKRLGLVEAQAARLREIETAAEEGGPEAVIKLLSSGEPISEDDWSTLAEHLPTQVEDLGLRVRSQNNLYNVNIENVGQLIQLPDDQLVLRQLMSHHGRMSHTDLEGRLAPLGLRLGMKIPVRYMMPEFRLPEEVRRELKLHS